jgi:CPA2 family monovalent cation:H+ antiporter-2
MPNSPNKRRTQSTSFRIVISPGLANFHALSYVTLNNIDTLAFNIASHWKQRKHMHDLAPLIRDLAVILGVASLVTLLFQKIKQPVVLGYLIAGIIIGPYTPPHALVSDIPNIQILSELGVIFLMFSLGLDFSFHKLKRVGFSASVTGFIEVALMLALGLLIGLTIGWSFNDSIFLGAALAISSTTIIIKALEELKLTHKRFAELIFGILVVEDLLAILLLVGLSTVVLTHQLFSFAMGWAAIKLVLVVGSWFLVGYFLVPTILHRIMHYASEETLTVVSVALCLFLVCLAAYFHYSTALGAFIMGSILAETSLVHRIEQLVRPLRNIFAAVFFVSIGMLIDPKIIFANFTLVLLLAAITIIGKLITTGVGAFLTGQSVNTSLRIGFSMAQIGEFSFIIIGLGLALNAINHSLYPIIVAVSAITTFTTPYFIRLAGYISHQLDEHLPERMKYFLSSYTNWVYCAQTRSAEQPSYRKACVRLLINGIIVAIIFTLAEHLILPKVNEFLVRLSLNKALTWTCAIILSSPFIWGMLTSFKDSNGAYKNQPTRTSSFFVSSFITLVEIIILSITYFQTWLVASLLLVAAIIFFKLLSKKLEKSYQWFENRLVKNLREKSIRRTRYEELAPWDTHLVEVHVGAHSDLAGKTLQELQLRQRYGLNIVAIYRGAETLLAPRGEQFIQCFDKLIVLGNDDQIETLRTQAKKEEHSKLKEADLLASFTLKAIFLEADHPFVGKPINESKIREEIYGLVVGLERHGNRILNPHSTTALQNGDLLLVVGDAERLKNL